MIAQYRVVLWVDPSPETRPIPLGAYCWEAREDAPMVWVQRGITYLPPFWGGDPMVASTGQAWGPAILRRLSNQFRDSARWSPAEISPYLEWGRSGRIRPDRDGADVWPCIWAEWLEREVFSRPTERTMMIQFVPLEGEELDALAQSVREEKP